MRALPSYPCIFVRGCRVIAAAPAERAARAASSQVRCFSSQPDRILTVTGIGATACTTAFVTAYNRSGSRVRDEPAPVLTIFGTGHPALISIQSACACSTAICAAAAMRCGSPPKICTAKTRSLSARRIRSNVFVESRVRASEDTISVYVKFAPQETQSDRNARSLYPATGARNRLPDSSSGPIRTG